MTEHPNLAAALVAGLAELSVVEKGRTAKIETKGGGSYTYSFADLGDVVKATRSVLASHGVVVLTPVVDHPNGLAVTVILLHASGERMEFGPLSFAAGSTAQATGSAVTYFRRYATVAALGMAAGDDDDAATAHPAKPVERDEVACRKCGELVAGALSDREPMRAHMIAEHGWVRLGDNRVIPPKIADGESGGSVAPALSAAGSEHVASSPLSDPASIDPRLHSLGIEVGSPEHKVIVEYAAELFLDLGVVLEGLSDGLVMLQYDEQGLPYVVPMETPAEKNAAERKTRERAGIEKARESLGSK